MSISWKVLAAAAAVTAVLSGCSSVSLDEGDKAGTLAGEQSAAQTTAVNPFLDPANPLYHRSVYFAFDSYEVSPEYAAVVEAHAKWLAANPEVKIVIQGNTDERGGREYNLALGQKRSEAVLQRLQLLGSSLNTSPSVTGLLKYSVCWAEVLILASTSSICFSVFF